MIFGNRDRTRKAASGSIRSQRGQMAVEMVVVMPVLLAVLGIMLNLMVYLGDCARFDRIAAEAVRTEAASPGYGEYGTVSRAQAVETRIEQSFGAPVYLSFTVVAKESSAVGDVEGEGIGFSLLPRQETYVCSMKYHPWAFGHSFFGIYYSGIPHTRSFVIDPYRPGALL